MWRTVEDKQIVVSGNFKRLVYGAEPLYRDDGLHILLKASRLPVEAGALADIEVGDLDVPFCRGVFTRDEAGKGALPDSTFLGTDSDDNR